MTKPITAEKVASKIQDLIEAQVTDASDLSDPSSTKIEVDVRIQKDRLREISGRKHIRNVFVKDVQKHLDDSGYMTEIVNGTIFVSDEIDSDPDVCIIDSI